MHSRLSDWLGTWPSTGGQLADGIKDHVTIRNARSLRRQDSRVYVARIFSRLARQGLQNIGPLE